MDRPIDPQTCSEARRRRLATLVVTAVAAAALLLILPGWMRPTVRRADLRTARVSRGDVEATISASGRVLPEHEHVVTSPIDTRVRAVLHQPGDRVAAGEALLELDVGAAATAVEKLDDQIALERNARERVELSLATRVAELRGRREIKALEVRSLELELERRRAAFDAGLETGSQLRKAETDAGRAHIELRQLDESMVHARRAAVAESDGLALKIRMLERDRAEVARRLARASAAADRDGVLTWVLAGEGVAVARGQEIARIADLSSFRIEATVSDVHSERLRVGLPVVVRTAGDEIRGEVTSVQPTVADGVLTFAARLDRPDHPALRHNLRVDVEIVTERSTSALRLERGVLGRLDGRAIVFVVRDAAARRTAIELGISSFDAYEVRAGLSEGDEVIVSDMNDYLHVEEVRLR